MSMEHYNKILAGKVAMPGKMKYSMNEFAHKIANRIDKEYRGGRPDSGLVALLCNAAWLGCEHIELMESGKNEGK